MIEQGKITPEYNGVGLSKFTWDHEALARIAKSADLRTNIIIRNGQDHGTYHNIPLKAYFNPKRLYDYEWIIGLHGKGAFDTSIDFEQRQAIVEVHDEMIWQTAISNEPNQRKAAGNAVAEFERLSKLGLSWALITEKMVMLKHNPTFTSPGSFFSAEGKVCCSMFGNLVCTAIMGSGLVLNLYNSYALREDYKVLPFALLGLIASIFGTRQSLSEVAKNKTRLSTVLQMHDDVIKNQNLPYIASLSDLNPLKHLYDLASGLATIYNPSTKLLTPQILQ